MSRSQAVRTGSKALCNEPLSLVAQLAWRWCYGLAVLLIGWYAAVLFLKSLPVSELDLCALSGAVPPLVWPVVKHILSGSGGTLVRLAITLAIALPLLWWPAAVLGHTAILSVFTRRVNLRTMATFEALRLLLSVGQGLAMTGAAAVAYRVASEPWGHDRDEFWITLVPMLFLIAVGGRTLMWQVRLGQVVGAVYGTGWQVSLHEAWRISSRSPAQFTWASTAFGIARLIVWAYGLVGGLVLMGVAARAPGAALLAALVLYSMVYSVARNAIEVARTAAWVRIVEWSGEQSWEPEAPAFIDAALPT